MSILKKAGNDLVLDEEEDSIIKPQTQYQNLTHRNGYCCSRSGIDNDFYNELMARGGEHILRHSQLFKYFHFETISDLSKNYVASKYVRIEINLFEITANVYLCV